MWEIDFCRTDKDLGLAVSGTESRDRVSTASGDVVGLGGRGGRGACQSQSVLELPFSLPASKLFKT